MKERPILFSAPMVRAILDGRKTQTRRVVMVHPSNAVRGWVDPASYPWVHVGKHSYDNDKPPAFGAMFRSELGGELFVPCPYGVPGDRLWVREACWIWGRWTLNGMTTTGRQRWRFRAEPYHRVRFDRPDLVARRESPQPGFDGLPGWVYRHARFMPRWASRLTLEVVSVRVERVRDISEYDALAEGVSGWVYDERCETARDGFRVLWDTINAARGFGWAANPWVWVVEFRRVTA